MRTQYGRGGLLPMAVFLTQNAPGLRTSPVKRGYWVVRRVLGEVIPPPPPVSPNCRTTKRSSDLPSAGHACAAPQQSGLRLVSCALRLVRTGVRGLRTGRRGADEGSGRPPGRYPGARSPAAARDGRERPAGVISASTAQKDFLDNFSRKLLAYALGRSLQLSDEPLIERMKAQAGARTDIVSVR